MAPEGVRKCFIDKIRFVDKNASKIEAYRRNIEFKKEVSVKWEVENDDKNILNEPTLVAYDDQSVIKYDSGEYKLEDSSIREVNINKNNSKKVFQYSSDIGSSDHIAYQIVLPDHYYACHYLDRNGKLWLIQSSGGNNGGKLSASLVARDIIQKQSITWTPPPRSHNQYLVYFIGPDENIFKKLLNNQNSEKYDMETHTSQSNFDTLKNSNDFINNFSFMCDV